MVCKIFDEEVKSKLKIKYDESKPDGMPKKLLDISKAKKYGWRPKNNLSEGFKSTYQYFLKNEC